MEYRSSKIDISIIIVNWNTKDLLCNCIYSILKQNIKPQIEIIVVDNGSTDGSVDMVQQEFRKVQLIKNTDNNGFASANNQGVKIARGRYLLFLNSDTILLDDTLNNIKSFADKHSKIGAIGCLVYNKDGTIQPSCMAFTSFFNILSRAFYLHRIFPKSKIFANADMTWFGYDEVKEIDAVKGCFIFIRHETFIAVGLFDERYFFYGEDMDLCYRLKRVGFKNLFFPSTKIIHFGGSSIKGYEYWFSLVLWASKLKFIKKHFGRIKYAMCYSAVTLLFAVRVCVWSLIGIVNPNLRNKARNKILCFSKGILLLVSFRQKKLFYKNKLT